ncbi:flagellar filament capping protein FliD [Aceticella autotrophica]|uniref:Flagellar hook-associated protein 2 n=1 Tax=Aceticella autotrophica TaxID=2755338 RepID=A0A975G9Y9_9THEO|nr:flagellar filament capping protein FliD [Aceticella autotrophica]QSZ27009.1 flagellar filament capping protein FliD [Aceticella autotrophica]
MDPISMNIYNTSNLLRMGGLASGLDTDSIVKKLMQAASIPLDELGQQKQFLQWKQEDLRDINTQLLSLRDNNVFNLKLQGTFLAKTVSSNTSIATATATTGAVNGSYTLNVSQLAKAATYTSNQITATTINNTGFDVTLTLNNQSLVIKKDAGINDVLTAINNLTPNTGVSATYDSGLGRLFLLTNTTGTNSNINLSANDANGQTVLSNLGLPTTGINATGQNAVFDFNGVTGIQSQTNNVTVAGINVTLTGIGTTSLSVSTDVDKIFNSIKSFVNSYNDIITKINTKLTEKRYYDYKPLTDAQKQAMKDSDITLWQQKARSGDLANDGTLSSIYFSLRKAVSASVDGVANGSLSAIGITSGQYFEGGKLYIDETKLRNAIQNNPQQVIDIFTKTTTQGTTVISQGVAPKLYDALNNGINLITQEAGGSQYQFYDNSFIGNQVSDINKRIADMQDYLSNLEQKYYNQFTQLETYMSQMNSQSAWLSQQLGGTAR